MGKNQVGFKNWGQVSSEIYHGENTLEPTAWPSQFSVKKYYTHTWRETGETRDMGIYLMPSIENWIALKQINWCNLQEQGLQDDRKLTLHLGLLNYSVPKRDQPPSIKRKSSLQASRPIWRMTALIQISFKAFSGNLHLTDLYLWLEEDRWLRYWWAKKNREFLASINLLAGKMMGAIFLVFFLGFLLDWLFQLCICIFVWIFLVYLK